MKKAITPLTALPLTGMGTVDEAWDAVSVSFDRFCLTAGIEALGTMMEQGRQTPPAAAECGGTLWLRPRCVSLIRIQPFRTGRILGFWARLV